MTAPPPRKLARVSDVIRESAAPTKQLARRPRFRVALITGVGALAVIVGGSVLRSWHPPGQRILNITEPIAFLVFAVACIRATAAELDELVRWRGGRSAGATIRMLVTIVGYLVAALVALGLTSYPIGHLLLGGAILGVILGIAAQQSLGNVFAGLVLLVARPFTVGNHIRVRSGALGGEFAGTVVAMSLTYVNISTTEGLLKVPNSAVLASAVGPLPHPQAGNGDGATSSPRVTSSQN